MTRWNVAECNRCEVCFRTRNNEVSSLEPGSKIMGQVILTSPIRAFTRLTATNKTECGPSQWIVLDPNPEGNDGSWVVKRSNTAPKQSSPATAVIMAIGEATTTGYKYEDKNNQPLTNTLGAYLCQINILVWRQQKQTAKHPRPGIGIWSPDSFIGFSWRHRSGGTGVPVGSSATISVLLLFWPNTWYRTAMVTLQ